MPSPLTPSTSSQPPSEAPAAAAGAVFTAQLQACSAPVPAPASQTLLQSFLQAGHELPSSCRNGSCRVCRRQVLQGRVHYRMQWPGLSAEEKAEGWVLPCVAYPDADIVLGASA